MTLIGDIPSPPGAAPVRWLGYGLAALGVVLWIFDVIRPDPLLTIAMLAAVPATLAVALYMPEAFQVRARRSQSLTFSPFVIFPALMVFGAAMANQLVDISWPLAVGAGGAMFCLVLAFGARGRPDLRCPLSMMAFITIAGGFYAYGATVMADVQFDRSAATSIPTTVTGKHLSYSKSSTYYHLNVVSWGPGPNSVKVARSVYDAVGPGDRVCVAQHPGALGAPWFTVGLCP